MSSVPFPQDSFPRQNARTRGFTLGVPKSVTVSEDGSRLAFLRSRGGDDPAGCLWAFDVDAGEERLVFDPAEGVVRERLSQEERDRRERARERLTGVTTYAADHALLVAAFAVGEHLFTADLVTGKVQELAPAGPAFDPRPDPNGRRVAYVAGRALRVLDLESGGDVELAAEDDPDVSWGLAEFIAAEEMDRQRGYWWSPDGERVAAARVDDGPLPVWHIASPIDPETRPRAVRYPRAGGPNAIVTLSVLDLQGGRVDVEWDRQEFPYLVRVVWSEHGPLTLLVQSRDQRTWRVLAVDPDAGGATILREDHDDAWLHILDGVPGWLSDGRMVFAADLDDTRRLMFDDEPVTPVGLQVDRVLGIGDDVLFAATDEPTELHVWRAAKDASLVRLTDRPGVHTAVGAGGTVAITSATLEDTVPITAVLRGGERVGTLGSLAETPLISSRPVFFSAGARELRSMLLLPGSEEPEAPLPVLLDPYGGPHFLRVTKRPREVQESQWLADQGFAVLVVDGRGTPGRGPAWEREVFLNLADPVLEDQVDALHAAAERFGFLDLSKVAIRGWSFGGYLACLAVLRRPDVFHAAVAGAPVTDQLLYDTHYTERYLGHPDQHAGVYRRDSVIDDAPRLRRPLMLIHGLADDNVYVANTLRLSRALTVAGRPHTVLPLSGITHAPIQEVVAENLLLLQVRFLRQALGIEQPEGS
jgi:dipeptidyl-peptidase-4